MAKPKPITENLGEKDAAAIREVRAGMTQLYNLPVAVNFQTADLLGRDFTFALTLQQAGTLLESLKMAVSMAVQTYGIPEEMLREMGKADGGN